MGSPLPLSPRWVRFDPRSRSRVVPLQGTVGRPLRELGVRSAGIDLLAGRFLAGTPRAATHLVWFPVRGRVVLAGLGGRQRGGPGQVAISPAGGPQWIEVESPRAMTTGVWFHLRDEPRWARLRGDGERVGLSEEGPNLLHLLERCLRETERPEPAAPSLALCYAEAAALVLDRELRAAGPDPVGPWRRGLDLLWAEVDANPRAGWTVGLLAARLGVSSGYLHRLCLREYGVGPLEKVRSLRIALATTYLRRTSLSLEAIAEAVGYGTPYALSKAFLARTGLRPGALRRGAPRQGAAGSAGAIS